MNKVQQLREVVKKLIPMIGARGIRVTQAGAKAFVETDRKTLKPVRVNIPHLPDDADERLCMAIQGFIDHEIGHVLDTDWAAVAESEVRGAAGKRPANAKMKPRQAGMFMSRLHNVVEDPYVERKMAERFKGSAYNVDKLHDIFIEKISKPAIDGAKTPMDRFGCILVPLVRSWAGQQKFTDMLKVNGYDKDPLVEAFNKAVPNEVKERVRKAKDSWETLEIAEILFDIMHPEPPPPPPMPPQQSMSDAVNEAMKDKPEQKDDEQSESPKSDDPDGEGNNQDKPEDEDDKGSDGEQSDEQQSADQEEGDTEEGENDGEEGAETEAGSEGDGEEDDADESEAEGDDEGAGGSDGDQDEDDSDGADSEGGSDAGDEEDDGDEAGDGDESAGGSSGAESLDEDDGDEAGDDDASGDDKGDAEGGSGDQDGETDDDGSSESDDGASSAERGDDTDDGDEAESGESDGDEEADGEVGSSGSEGDEDDGESRSAGEKADAEDEAETGRHQLEQAPESSPFQGLEVENLGDDMSKGIAFIITNEATRNIKGLDYRVYTTDWDVCEKFPVPAGNPTLDVYRPSKTSKDRRGRPRWEDVKLTLNELVQDLDERTGHMVAPMQKDIERMLAARSQILKVPGFRSGRLHSGSLHRLRVGDDRVFRRTEEHKSQETAVTLLIDNSGSMSGEKMQMAMSAGYALSSTLQRVNIKHEVIGFTTMNPRVDKWHEQQRDEEERIGKPFSRYGALYHPIYKEINERLTPEVKRRFAIAPYRCPMSGNTDGESVRFAGNRLALRPEPRKVLIVLSDGHPAGMSYFPEEIYSDLHKAVEECEKKRIETIGIGIMDDAVETFYPKSVVLKDLNELPKQVMKELKGILLQ